MVAWVFPGQGSQRRGMGQGLFDEVKEFTSVEREVDAILGYSVRQLCLEDPHNQLKETQFTQPALFIVNALHFYKAVGEGARPHFLAGHSLGEYNALLAAGVFDLVTGIRLVKKRGELMSAAKSGGMGAVIGLDIGAIETTLRRNGLDSIDIANLNSPAQTVISGMLADLQRAGPLLEAAGARMYMPLPVSAAFHSRYMADAARGLEGALQGVPLAAPQVSVVANVTAKPYPAADAPEGTKSLLVQQITRPVQWTASVRFLLQQGVSVFREIGPGNVLTRLIQQIQQTA